MTRDREEWIEQQIEDMCGPASQSKITVDYARQLCREIATKAMAFADAHREAGGEWKVGLPTVPGWYWFRNVAIPSEQEPHIVFVRDYAGDLAIGNARLKGWDRFEEGEWCGPLPEPGVTPPPATRAVKCQCTLSDAWRCAKQLGLRTVACYCSCHTTPAVG